jgi:nitrogen regulatory protein PII
MGMVVYNEAIDIEVMGLLGNCILRNYTKVLGVYGKGEKSGTHLGDDIWPGRNNMLYIACSDEESKKIISCVQELRKTLGHEGVKAFVFNLEEVT